MSNRPDTSPFRKVVLIPLWIIRIIVMACDVVVYALAIAAVAYLDSGRQKDDKVAEEWKSAKDAGLAVGTVIAIMVVVMVLILICLILDLVCVVKRYRHTLTPKFFLVTNIMQTSFWTLMFILTMIGTRSVLAICLSIFIYFSFLGMLVYAIIVFRRERKNAMHGEQVKMMDYSTQQQQTGYQPQYSQPAGYHAA